LFNILHVPELLLCALQCSNSNRAWLIMR
jgi:hypothetical protein